MPDPTLLLTGFEPYGAHGYNPSQEVVRALEALPSPLPGVRLVTRVLPVTFAGVSAELPRLIAAERPDAFVGLGLRGSGTMGDSASVTAIDLERIALNLDDCRQPDNAGDQPEDQPAVPGGPALYRSTLPLPAMLRALQSADFAARISNHAGTYVCNHLFYIARHVLESTGVPCGFIHLPQVQEGGAQGWTQERLTRAVLIALGVVSDETARQEAKARA